MTRLSDMFVDHFHDGSFMIDNMCVEYLVSNDWRRDVSLVILVSRDVFVFNADFISFHIASSIIAMASLGDQRN